MSDGHEAAAVAPQDEVLVFDTSPLTHFARQNWLGVLKAVVGNRLAVIPDVVAAELREIAHRDARVEAALSAGWIEHRELRTHDEIAQFAYFSSLLVRGDRNRGEAGVLALAKTGGHIAVIDDGAGRRAATNHGITLRPTLALLCEAIRRELLTVISSLRWPMTCSPASIAFRSARADSRRGHPNRAWSRALPDCR